jgi:hypothetical protein
MGYWKRGFTFLACAALLLLCAKTSPAQISAATGAIQGTVTDPQGATIPGAKVTLTNTDTGVVSADTTTKADGSFVFPLLSPGNYRIDVAAQGFKELSLSGINVQITKVTVANAKLEIGAVSTEVMVTGAALQVDTRTATTGDVIVGQQIRDLPLPTRNFLDLTLLQAGATARMESAATVGRGTPILDVAGSRATTNNFVLDGVDANAFSSGNLSQVPVPDPDAVQEFRVSTSMYDASQGRGSGGNINVLMRSGTADLHGGLFDFYRDTIFDANDFFLNAQGKPRPILQQNQFGGSIGGPVPKLKKTFWFFNYQGTRQKNGVSSLVSGFLPVLPARTSGESEATYANALASAFNSMYQASSNECPSHSCPALTGSMLDPVAVNLLLQPGPYGGYLYPSGVGTLGNLSAFAVSLPTIYNEDQYSASVDRDIFRNNHFTAQYFRANETQFSPTGGTNSGLGQGLSSPVRDDHAAITDTETITTSLINEAVLGFTHILSASIPTEGVTVGDIGETKWDAAEFPGIPAFSITGVLGFGGAGVNSAVQGGTTTLTAGNTLSWTHGKHTIRFGGEFRRSGWNYENDYGTRGSMSFPDFPGYLIGSPSREQVDVGIFNRNFRANAGDAFVQDDFHVTHRLVLNIGGRWDYIGWPYDTQGRVATFDPSLIPASCIANGGGSCIDQGFVAPAGTPFGQPGVSQSVQEQQRLKNFAPRLGFAFDPTGSGKMSVRGGYGIFYIQTSGQTVLQPISSPPWVEQYLVSGVGVVGSDVLANPWPVGLPQPSAFPILPQVGQFKGNFNSAGQPIFVTSSGAPAVSLSLYGFTRNLRIPYVQQWNLTTQYEFIRGWVVEVGYIGSHGVGLLVEPSLNQAMLVNAANPGIGGLTVNSTNNATIRAPILGFSPAGLNLVTNQGMSSYNAGILEVRHEFAHNFLFRMDYTYSKSIDNDSGPTGSDLDSFYANQIVPSFDRAQSDFNEPNRLVFTYVWQIPGPHNGWEHSAFSGWGISGIYTLQSGFPFSITSTTGGGIFGLNGSVNLPAEVSCSSGFTNPGVSITNYINKACFAAVPNIANNGTISGFAPTGGSGSQTYTIAGTPGTSDTCATNGNPSCTIFGYGARNIARGPFEQRFDLALTRDIHIHERYDLQLRAEAFKLFNNPIFANPAANVSVASTFGAITSTLDGTGRILQFAAKFNF